MYIDDLESDLFEGFNRTRKRITLALFKGISSLITRVRGSGSRRSSGEDQKGCEGCERRVERESEHCFRDCHECDRSIFGYVVYSLNFSLTWETTDELLESPRPYRSYTPPLPLLTRKIDPLFSSPIEPDRTLPSPPTTLMGDSITS